MFRWLAGALGAVLIGGCVYAAFHLDQWGFDDAFISYRYAENLVQGHGLVFNPGEQVEGYSNFLYVLIMAAGLCVIPREGIWVFSLILNIACLCAALAILLRRIRSRWGDASALLWCTPFALSPPLWLAAWTGLETALVVLLIVAIWSAIPQMGEAAAPVGRLCALLALIVLARVDGFVVAGIAVLYLGLGANWRPARAAALSAAGTMALQVGFRLLYYGYPLSNTYYAKVASPLPARLAYAWASFVHEHAELYPYILLIALAAGVRLLERRPFREAVDFGLFFTVSWVGYWFYVGGDLIPKLRFLLPLIPIGLAAGAELFAAERMRRFLPAPLAPLLVAALLLLPFADSRLSPFVTTYDPWKRLGEHLGERHPGSVIAVDAAGKIPYFSRLQTIDMLGLNDLHIAHSSPRNAKPGHGKFDPAYVIGRKPDLIAAWVINRNFDLGWGLTSRRYTDAGYRLAYLQYMYMREPPIREPIVDVRAMGLAQRRDLLRSGYSYAVLERTQ